MRDKEKRKLSQKRYKQSCKGRLNKIKCRHTPAGIASRKKYVNSHRVQLLEK
jgi:hypothetical protein